MFEYLIETACGISSPDGAPSLSKGVQYETGYAFADASEMAVDFFWERFSYFRRGTVKTRLHKLSNKLQRVRPRHYLGQVCSSEKNGR